MHALDGAMEVYEDGTKRETHPKCIYCKVNTSLKKEGYKLSFSSGSMKNKNYPQYLKL